MSKILDKVLRVGLLFDFYGALLTDKQQRCLEMHYQNDLSLAEIADEFAVSRQAVHDILRRSEQILEEYEQKLQLVERYQWEQQKLQQVYQLIEAVPEQLRQLPEICLTLETLRLLLDDAKEV
ncbi:MAG TPA: YlxM family DNA-binding protein [Negativicutes bacterium]